VVSKSPDGLAPGRLESLPIQYGQRLHPAPIARMAGLKHLDNRARRADRDAAVARLEPRLGGVDERVRWAGCVRSLESDISFGSAFRATGNSDHRPEVGQSPAVDWRTWLGEGEPTASRHAQASG
jgi:hypothetical protein